MTNSRPTFHLEKLDISLPTLDDLHQSLKFAKIERRFDKKHPGIRFICEPSDAPFAIVMHRSYPPQLSQRRRNNASGGSSATADNADEDASQFIPLTGAASTTQHHNRSPSNASSSALSVASVGAIVNGMCGGNAVSGNAAFKAALTAYSKFNKEVIF